MSRSIKIRTPDEVARAREAGHLIAEVLAMLKPHVVPGVTTAELDDLCHDYIVGTLKCIPSNIGYHGYPRTACISPNHVSATASRARTRSSRRATSSTST